MRRHRSLPERRLIVGAPPLSYFTRGNYLRGCVLGPIGAFGYMEQWGKFAAALFTLNGLGAWWIESLYSVPQLVLIENRRSAKWALEQLPFSLQLEASHGV